MAPYLSLVKSRSRYHSSCVTLVLVVLCILVTSLPANAAFHWDREEQKTLNGILHTLPRTELELPDSLHNSREVYVFVTTGAAYTKVTLLSSSLPYSSLIKLISKSVDGQKPPEKGYVYSSPHSYSAATLFIAKPRYGAHQVTNEVRLGALVQRLISQGFKPYVLLRVPNYVSFSNLDLPKLERSRYTWYNATGVPEEFKVKVQGSLSPELIALLFYLRFLLPGIGVLGFVVGLVLSLNRRLPPKTRINCYDWLALMIPMTAALVGISSTILFGRSAFEHLIIDVWLADPSADGLFIDMYVSPMFLMFVVTLSGLIIRHRIFRRLDEEPEILDLEFLLRRTRRCGAVVGFVLAAFLLFCLTTRPIEFNFLMVLTEHGSILPGFMLPLVFFMINKYVWYPNIHDADLTQRANELAPLIGVDIKEVRVANSSIARRDVNGCALIGKGVVIVTQQAVGKLSPQQMDWLLAHELAHFRDSGGYKKALRPLFWVDVPFTLVFFSILAFSTYTDSLPMIWLMSIFPILFFMLANELYEVRRRLEYESDIQAFLATRDLNAAISALKAIAGFSDNQEEFDDVEMDEHPKLIKRIKAIRQVAARMGIDVCSEQV